MKGLSTSLLRIFACLMVVLGSGCGLPEASNGQSDRTITSQSEPPRDGILATSRPGRATNTPLADDEIPPSLPITELIEFTHKPTGITGLRPANWTLFSGKDSFQVSSSPEAPDGFIGRLTPVKDLPNQDARAGSEQFLELFKKNQADGPDPEIIEEEIAADGSGVMLVETTGRAQGSDRPFRFMTYARTTITPEGLLAAVAIVPAEQFPDQEDLIREMVDSVQIK